MNTSSLFFFAPNNFYLLYKEGNLMAINIKFNEVGIIGLVIGAIGTGYGIWREMKSNNLAKKLDTTLSSLESKTTVDISQDVIDKAVKNAVEHHANACVKKVAQETADLIRDDMDSMIRKDVDRVYNDLKESVQERVSEEIASIDYDEFREEIQRKAEHKVFEEVKDAMNVGKIFGGAITGRGIDFEGLAKVAEKLPAYQREGFLTSIVKAMR
jgi:hypothetical protein